MTTVKITTVGNSLGIVLPREVLQRLRVEKGDVLHLVETRAGIELVPYEPEFVAQIEALEATARSEREVLLGLQMRAVARREAVSRRQVPSNEPKPVALQRGPSHDLAASGNGPIDEDA